MRREKTEGESNIVEGRAGGSTIKIKSIWFNNHGQKCR